MKTITIIGFGRFGKTLYRLLKDDFDITIYTRRELSGAEKFTTSLQEAYASEVIFYAVPISSFDEVIKTHKQYITDSHVLIDVLSVKLHAKQVFEKYLGETKTQALLTHPMFGPDSSKDGFAYLPIILDQFLTNNETYAFWKNYFTKKKLQVIEMTADEHDKTAANSQGVTHFIGRVLEEYKLTPTLIDSLGTKKLHEVVEQTCHDTWQLFTDLQHYNPYTLYMREKVGEAVDSVYNKLLPEQKHPDYLTIGIQGGKGSFNEEAVQYYIEKEKIKKYKIEYLYTSKNVMKALHEGRIDRGQFAIHNSIGGIVDESIEAMATYKFHIVEQFAIKISHALMIHPDTDFSEITTIMTHPQVLAQCKTNLKEKYPQLKQTSGGGELIDHAVVAKQLSEGKLPKSTAVMGSKVLAKLYNLTIVEDNLQDAKENWTSFLMMER